MPHVQQIGAAMALSCGVTESELLVLSEVVDVVTVGRHPVLVGFDDKRSDQAQQLSALGEDARDMGAAADLLVETLEHIATFEVLVMLARQAEEGERLLDDFLDPAVQPGICPTICQARRKDRPSPRRDVRPYVLLRE